MSDDRRYTVSGIDYAGDLQSFASADAERAVATFRQFQEDLEAVTVSDALRDYLNDHA